MRERILCLSVCLLLILTGCAKGTQKEFKEYLAMEEKVKNGEFKIYYLNKGASNLKHLSRKIVSTEQDEIIRTLLFEITNPPASEEVLPPIKEDVVFKEFQIRQNVLYLYFDEFYASMDYSRQILALGAYVKTLTQIEGIDYVAIYTGEVELMDKNAKPIGPVGSDEIVDGVSDVNAYRKAEIVLYFPDVTGEDLIPEKREIFYNTNVPLETVIVDELIAGPKDSNLYRSLPTGTKLISTSVVDGVCYINLSREFMEPIAGQKETTAIYSIVNSLTELDEIQKVQISVEGLKNLMYRDLISLDTFFEREK